MAPYESEYPFRIGKACGSERICRNFIHRWRKGAIFPIWKNNRPSFAELYQIHPVKINNPPTAWFTGAAVAMETCRHVLAMPILRHMDRHFDTRRGQRQSCELRPPALPADVQCRFRLSQPQDVRQALSSCASYQVRVLDREYLSSESHIRVRHRYSRPVASTMLVLDRYCA